MIAIAETEIWPNLILAAQSRHIPVILINGRMTEKADLRYRWIKAGISQVLSCHERFFFKTQCDADRYAEYGVGRDRATVAGDMKFDAPLVERIPERIAELRRQAGVAAQEFLLVAGSTRPGEEEMLCRNYVAIKSACPRFRLLLAPRHIDRAEEIRSLIGQMGLECRIFDESYGEPSESAIILVNRMGILADLYSSADLAFVGGTLVNIGGHNILEPVWAGAPVLFGPSVANVTEAAAYVEQHGYGKRVQSVEDLAEVISEFCAGRRTFQTKTADQYRHSPTAMIGDYMLRRFPHV
jgi:3-deoxy-D-manno-octulosonic-acid transferase